MQSVIFWVVIMRVFPAIALLTSSLALAACGGGGDLNGSDTLADRVNAGGVCDLTQDSCIDTGGSSGGTTTVADKDKDGIPDKVDTDGSKGSGAGGNTTGLTTGNATIALQAGKLDNSPTALSILTSSLTPTAAATNAAILSSNKPKKLKFQIDTKTDKNGQWAVPIEMKEDIAGTRALEWVRRGHVLAGTPMSDGYPVLSPAGLPAATWNPTYNRYETAAGNVVDHREGAYWTSLTAVMSDKANGGSKGNYREYVIIDQNAGRDEVLQVWAWKDSYAVQYQNAVGGGAPKQQAWAFHGNATAAMPVSGSAVYKGRFVGTANTSNWINPNGSEIDPNGTWRIQGGSEIRANFGTDQIRGTLTPETWSAVKNDAEYTWYTSAADNPSTPTIKEPNHYFYESRVEIDAELGGNKFAGDATVDKTTVQGNNDVKGGFFGSKAREVTGVFAAEGIVRYPLGGTAGQSDHRRAFINMNGAFNALCTAPGGTCAP
jgi:hypothetical protein